MSDRSKSNAREWNSDAYHRLSGPLVSWGKKVLARLDLRGDEVVLDAGCGTGRLTADLLEALPRGRVVGIDASQNMLGAAREHLTPQFGNNLSLIACDFLYLPFTRTFDGIVSTAAFHWVLDHDKLFTNLHDVLVPGGWLEAQCGGGPNVAHLRARGRALAARPQFAPYLADFQEPWNFQDADGAASTLKRAGFLDVETSVESAPTVLQDAREYEEFVRNIIFHRQLAKLPTEQLRTEFMDNLTQQAAAADPPFSIDYWRLNLRGRVRA